LNCSKPVGFAAQFWHTKRQSSILEK